MQKRFNHIKLNYKKSRATDEKVNGTIAPNKFLKIFVREPHCKF